MSSNEPTILRPQPQRMWTLSPPPSEPTSPIPPSSEADLDSPIASQQHSRTSPLPFSASRTRSVLNLTASTLAGIYAPDDDSSLFGVTPLHTGGTSTPANYPATPSLLSSSRANAFSISDLDRAHDRMAPVIGALEQPQFRPVPRALSAGPSSSLHIRVLRGLGRAALLFFLGAAYGSLVTHLHDARNLAPVKIDGLRRESYSYTVFWGAAGILLGTALPIVDAIWAGEGPEEIRQRRAAAQTHTNRTTIAAAKRSGNGSGGGHGAAGLGADWNPMVRSIGAFVGIGFAIRRLPWQSTLQASVTLALVNPCLWYMIDRTVPGFTLASVVGVLGTTVLLGTNVVPMPDVRAGGMGADGAAGSNASSVLQGDGGALLALGIEQGTLAVWAWVASVLFCSCLCFGNIGRKLALGLSAR